MSRLEKKRLETYSAHRATKGIRSFKCGQSIWFIGYKKHSLRLWVSRYQRGVLLVPLVSWVTPANVSEAQLLVASLRRCEHRWGWWPKYVVADMGYLSAEIKRQCRQRWQVGERPQVTADLSQWNEFSVIARGNRLEHKLNGRTTSVFIDHDERNRALAGLIAIQLHAGTPHKIFV